MDKIRAFEVSHSVYELYLAHVQVGGGAPFRRRPLGARRGTASL
jgi:hypothetical protein